MMFQIDGLSGTGKSTLATELNRRGCRAVDADATMRFRLLTRTNNDFGKDPTELAEQLDLNAHVLGEARRTGRIVIDAARRVETIADEILSSIR